MLLSSLFLGEILSYTDTNKLVTGSASSNWYQYPTTPSITYYPVRQEMTAAEIDAVADRVIEKLKAELLETVMNSDPKAFMALLLKAVAE